MIISLGLMVFAALFIIGIVLFAQCFYLVRQAQVVVIERFGRFSRLLTPGLHVVVPFIETPRKVSWSYISGDQSSARQYQRYILVTERIDLREAVLDFPKQNVITKDNVTMEINALMYYQITDPKAAVYEVENLCEAIEKLTQTTLRAVIGAMDLDETLVSRDYINEKLRLILDEATDRWGVKVNRVELQEVNPPHDIRIAMEKQMRAERDRRAVILEAEGKKSAAILEAEGEKEAQILAAQGQAESKIISAEGEAQARLRISNAESQAIVMIQQAVPQGDPLPYLIAMQYLKTLPEMTKGKNDKLVVLPYEATTLLGSLSSIKTIFNNIQ